MQQVYVVLQQERYRNLDSEDDLVPLGVQILYNLRKEAWRKAARETSLDPDFDIAAPAPDLTRKELQDRMLAAIEKQDPGCRELQLLQLKGFSYDEIGEKLGISKDTAYVRSHRCLNRLRAKMGVRDARK